MVEGYEHGGPSWLPRVVVAGTLASVVLAGTGWLAVDRLQTTVSGTPRAAESVGRSDDDQIRDVLQAISDAYNRKDVKSAEGHLCARSRSAWSPLRERVWMTYRLQHGTAEFTIRSIDVNGAVAQVTGTQTYANDARPHDFSAAMGRSVTGWKMC